jgi:hypothetical protein
MSPARNWSTKIRDIFQYSAGGTYSVSSVALKRAVVDLNIASRSPNGSTLEVACPPPELEPKVDIVLFTENSRMELYGNANES